MRSKSLQTELDSSPLPMDAVLAVRRVNHLYPLVPVLSVLAVTALIVACGGQADTTLNASSEPALPTQGGPSTPLANLVIRCVWSEAAGEGGVPAVGKYITVTPRPTEIAHGQAVPLEDLTDNCMDDEEFRAGISKGGSYGVEAVNGPTLQPDGTPVAPTATPGVIPENVPGQVDPDNLFFNIAPSYEGGELKLVTGPISKTSLATI